MHTNKGMGCLIYKYVRMDREREKEREREMERERGRERKREGGRETERNRPTHKQAYIYTSLSL